LEQKCGRRQRRAATLAADIQRKATAAFVKSWHDLRYCIASKSEVLAKPNQT
jgi:hypothetical protein